MIDRPSKPTPESQKPSASPGHFYDEGDDVPVQDGDLDESSGGQEDIAEGDFPSDDEVQEPSVDDEGYPIEEENTEGEEGAEGDGQYYVQEQFDPVPEKTFLQKYFTLIAIVGVVVFLGGAFYFQFKDSLFKSAETSPAPPPVLEKIVTPSSAPPSNSSTSLSPVGTSAPTADLFPSLPSKRPMLSEREPPNFSDLSPNQTSSGAPHLTAAPSMESNTAPSLALDTVAPTPLEPVTPPSVSSAPAPALVEPPAAMDQNTPILPSPSETTSANIDNSSGLGTFVPPSIDTPPATPPVIAPEAQSPAPSPITSLNNAQPSSGVMAEKAPVLEKSMDDLRLAIESLQQKLSVLETVPPTDAAGQTQLKETVVQLQQAIDDLKSLKAQAVPIPSTTIPSPTARPRAVVKKANRPASAPVNHSPWILRSATYGQAWVVHKTSHVQRRVVPGDILEGAGRVISVEKEGGQWTVSATDGKIR